LDRDFTAGERERMSFDQIYAIGLASITMVVVFGGLYQFKRILRKRLFPTEKRSGREDAVAELLRLQARLEERASQEKASRRPGDQGKRGRP
jgi:hypothetical protein